MQKLQSIELLVQLIANCNVHSNHMTLLLLYNYAIYNVRLEAKQKQNCVRCFHTFGNFHKLNISNVLTELYNYAGTRHILS